MSARQSAYRGLAALDERKLFRRSIRLLPALARRGVAPADALAIAYNAAFLHCHLPRSLSLFSPKQVLKRFSLSQIASMCESILDGGEWGVNLNYKEGNL